MSKRLLPLAALILVLCSCGPVKTTADGFIVKAGNGDYVRLEAVNENIIRVSSTPDGKFPESGSLSVISQPDFTDFTVSENETTASLSTGRVVATVSKKTGAVRFTDSEGNELVEEDRREFAPIDVEGTSGWTVRQVFNSDEDEGFYGLGQHQADEWNYKGKNEELYQYNTKISIPFIVSTKRYGILWDSYSLCRWGDIRPYAQLGEVFKLYDKDGAEGALTGTYVPSEMMKSWKGTETLVRRETAINQEFLRVPQCDVVMNAPDFPYIGANVTFEGDIEPQESGKFNFLLYYAGYMKVYFDGEEVVPEIWRTAWNPNSHKFSADMEAGKKVHIRIDWKPDGGQSYCALKVLSPVDPEEQAKMSWWGEMQKQIDYYFIAGDSIDDVISGYRTITGKSQIMPKWAMGYWQSRERYSSQEMLLSTLREFREKQVPVDNIVQDWQYWEPDQWGSHEFDATRYPDPKGMIDTVHALGAKFMISVWPKFYTGTEHFNELDSKGWIYRTAVRDSVIDWLGYAQSFYDAYAEGARALFWQQMKDHLLPLGVDAWWMDASEPNIHDCTDMDYRKAMCGPTALGSSTEYFNAYALMNAEAIYNGQRSADPDTRVFLLTRNGFSGLQRYSTASWSGDIGTRWEDMKTQISAGLNFSISGIPYWTQDVGGFSVENRYAAAQTQFEATGKENEDLKEWRELNVRWHQWGIYNPLYRAHGQFPNREPWNIAPEGHPAYDAIVAQNNTRYELMPYIYTLAAKTWFDDYTIMRPLVMDFTDDPVAQNISDEYMFGDALLVCPVYKYQARSRQVYLPRGGWYDIHDSYRYYEGGRTMTAAAPFEFIPVYAKAGEIVVSSDEIIQSTAQAQKDLVVTVFTGENAEFRYYEDEGTNYNYEKGLYAWIPFSWDENGKTVTLGKREGEFPGMIQSRNITVRIVGPQGQENRTVYYNGEQQTINFQTAE